jgi:hypothetical protein
LNVPINQQLFYLQRQQIGAIGCVGCHKDFIDAVPEKVCSPRSGTL